MSGAKDAFQNIGSALTFGLIPPATPDAPAAPEGPTEAEIKDAYKAEVILAFDEANKAIKAAGFDYVLSIDGITGLPPTATPEQMSATMQTEIDAAYANANIYMQEHGYVGTVSPSGLRV